MKTYMIKDIENIIRSYTGISKEETIKRKKDFHLYISYIKLLSDYYSRTNIIRELLVHRDIKVSQIISNEEYYNRTNIGDLTSYSVIIYR